MSRTWRKGEADYKHSQEYKNRRNNRKQKANSHYENFADDYENWHKNQGNRKSNSYYDFDTDSD